MSVGQMMAAVRAQAQMAQSGKAHTRVGTVSNFDPGTWTVQVLLLPEGTQTNRIPLLSPWVGNGWGLFAPPSVGDLVEVGFAEGDTDAGYALGRFFNDVNQPLPVQSGEFWIVHKSGSALKFHNDGSVEIIANTNLTATVGGNLSATVSGTTNIQSTGNATINTSGKATMSASGDAYVTAGANISLTGANASIQTSGSNMNVSAVGNVNVTCATMNVN